MSKNKKKHYNSNTKKQKQSNGVFSTCIIILVLCCSAGLAIFGNSAKNTEVSGVDIISGDILDTNNNYIAVANETGGQSTCLYIEEYGFLIGYNTENYGSFGLKEAYDEYLTGTVVDGKGATLKLTTDNELQSYCYNLLGDNEGSVIVMENKTGKILALASKAEMVLDVNNITQESLAEYDEIKDFWYTHGISEYYAPGSTMKMVTAAAAIENGLEDTVFYDTGSFTIGDSTINNFNSTEYGILDLTNAFAVSSNSYFMQLGILIGRESLLETAEDFLIGETIATDFAILNSYINIEENSDLDLALTAFGQGSTQITAIHIGLIAQSIANNSEMIKPYIIDEIISGGQVIHKTGTVKLTDTVSVQTSELLKELMINNAQNQYNMSESEYGTVGLKTGTCELPSDGNQTYVVGFTDTYTIVIAYNETEETSNALIPLFKDLVSYLNLNFS